MQVNAISEARMRELQRLVPLWPSEIADTSPAGRHRLLKRLRSALRCERRLGLAGHWSYDVARHRQLLEAYRREANALMQHRGASLSEASSTEAASTATGR